MNNTLLLYIPLFPLLGAIFNGLLPLSGRRPTRSQASTIACLMSGLAFLVSLKVFWNLWTAPESSRFIQETLFTWIASGQFQVNFAFRADTLTAVMLLVVTGVGSLIHIYSVGYMAEDESYARYFAYLNFFMFAMLMLVLGDSLLVMFIGWEGVGLASYLLIGFWFTDTEKAKAGMKAFVVNRIGDLGFLVGIFLLFWYGGAHAINFVALKGSLATSAAAKTYFLGLPILEWAGIALFVGAMGKSAQIPLYVWLPDAMAGPTPVSALIHAATMVTAGVYMVARMNFLYSIAPTASLVVASFGAMTALFAASIGVFQYDIKKVLAYSTVSQLGFMFIGVGVGAYTAGIFHLMTHAFFKALLFLGAGSVIVGMHHEQDVRQMGGLRKYMKITYWTFFAATLAIIGFPGFSGFFSKDEILWMALVKGHPVVWALGSIAAVLTAFYMVRLLILTFFGDFRADEEVRHHLHDGIPHESPASMTVPLVILAFLAVFGGLLGLPHILSHHHYLAEWLKPVLGHSTEHHFVKILGRTLGEAYGMSVAIGGMLIGALAAWLTYGGEKAKTALVNEEKLQESGVGGIVGVIYRVLYNKYYVDEIYHALIVNPIHRLSRYGLWPFDQLVIDGLVNFSAKLTQFFARILSFFQTGNVKVYLYGMTVGLVSLLLWLMLTSSSF